MKSLILLCAACAPSWKATPHDRLFQVEPPVELARSPARQEPSDGWNKVELSIVRPLGLAVSPGTYVSLVADGPPADDVNRLGEVADSAWFENRIGRRTFTDDEVRIGAATDSGLAPGPLSVISSKIEGVSPGFVVRDGAGIVWYIKLDHPAFPEVSTSAEVISSRLLWLAGYHVPSMQVGDVEVSRFVLDPHATTKNRLRQTVPLEPTAFARLMVNTNPNSKGQIRILYSRQIPGELLGPFDYRGRRVDDPNDTVAHQQRRSLRGLWLFSAWLNNTDTRAENTMDTFRAVTPDHRGVVEHYLIDFGNAFGATGLGEKAAIEGWEYLVDWSAIVRNIASFGTRIPPYLHVERSAYRSVGLFEAKQFTPKRWRSEIPNPAFDQRTSEDLFWAGAVLAAIQPTQIRAACDAGHYTEDGAAAYVAETLLERRRKLLEYAFRGFLELARPRIEATTLVLDDLRAMGQLPPMGPVAVVATWDRTRGSDQELARGTATSDGSQLRVRMDQVVAAATKIGIDEDPYVTVELTSAAGRSLRVHLRLRGARLIPIAVER